MLDYTKPNTTSEPVPAFITAGKRIRELADAISNTASQGDVKDADRMRSWATEIVMQCDIMKSVPFETKPKRDDTYVTAVSDGYFEAVKHG